MTAFQSMKQNHSMQVLRLLRARPRSRAELARETGLTRAAMTGIVYELLQEGLLQEGKIADASVGRRPTLLELRSDACYAVGLDLAREGVTLCFLDFTMRPVWERFYEVTQPREEILRDVRSVVAEAKNRVRLLGLGVVSPGSIDKERGCVLTPKGMESWHGFSVSELKDALSLPVILERDTGALAIAEKQRMGTENNYLILLADHGLGGGFVYEGRLFGTSRGLGCEIGHVAIDRNGPICSCGNRGCAELYASIPYALEQARERGREMDWQGLVTCAEQGDAVCLDVLSQQAEALAEVSVSAVNLLEPDCIVLEGALCAAHWFFQPYIRHVLEERCFTEHGKSVRVETSSLPANARAVSAANLALERFFEEVFP